MQNTPFKQCSPDKERPPGNIQKPQRAQNSIARIVTGTRRSEHITPVLARLHWLKIAEQIEYKVVLLTFKALKEGKPDYLSGQLQLCAPVRQLRLSDRKNRLYLNSHQTTFASCAVRNAAPVVWNNLPHQLTDDLSCPASFRRNLKTRLFSKSFRHWLQRPVRNCDSSIYFWLTYICCITNCLISCLVTILWNTLNHNKLNISSTVNMFMQSKEYRSAILFQFANPTKPTQPGVQLRQDPRGHFTTKWATLQEHMLIQDVIDISGC